MDTSDDGQKGKLISISVKWPEKLYTEIKQTAEYEHKTFGAEAIFLAERGLEYLAACDIKPGLKAYIQEILDSDPQELIDEIKKDIAEKKGKGLKPARDVSHLITSERKQTILKDAPEGQGAREKIN